MDRSLPGVPYKGYVINAQPASTRVGTWLPQAVLATDHSDVVRLLCPPTGEVATADEAITVALEYARRWIDAHGAPI